MYLCRYSQLLFSSYLYTRSVVFSVYLLDIHVIKSSSIIYPGCLDRACQHTTYWPVFLLTWCYSSHSRPVQLSIWAACVCVFVCKSDPGPSVLSAVGAVLHISHMTAPQSGPARLHWPHQPQNTSTQYTHNYKYTSTVCIFLWIDITVKYT